MSFLTCILLTLPDWWSKQMSDWLYEAWLSAWRKAQQWEKDTWKVPWYLQVTEGKHGTENPVEYDKNGSLLFLAFHM